MRGRLQALADPERRSQSAQLSESLGRFLEESFAFAGIPQGLRVAAYRPHLQTPEVDPGLLLKKLSDGAGAKIFFAVSRPGSAGQLSGLEMRGFPGPLEGWGWSQEGMGTLEVPVSGGEPGHEANDVGFACLPSELDILLVPALAFGRSGERLGRGGGFYDRLLPQAPRALKIGLCYDFQLLERIPMEAEDFPMDVVLTPEQIRTVNPGRLASWIRSLKPTEAGERSL